jgi:hypothetical protein
MDSDSVERRSMDSAPAEPPDTDAGVPASPQPPIATAAEAASTHETAEPAAGGAPPRRALKLVVRLRPANAIGYRALIALGSDGCDPVLRAADVADLAGALEEVPGLLAEAAGRWQLQPRYPTTAEANARPAAPSRAPASPRQRPRRGAAATPDEQGPAPTSAQPPATTSAQADQLALFG